MKYIVLSFDDGRKDFYKNALPILKKYKLSATLNVVTDFLGKSGLCDFASANYECITEDEMVECAGCGIEIASHSSNHTNDIFMIEKSIEYLKKILNSNWGGGFASPSSEIDKENFNYYKNCLLKSGILYIRSGNQIKRDGYFHAGLYVLYKITKSNLLFRLYNQRNIIDLEIRDKKDIYFYPSITCNSDNGMRQIAAFIETIPDNHAAILMFHSILNSTDKGWGKDRWYNSTVEFEKLCRWLKKRNDIEVVTNKELCLRMFGGES